MHPCNSLICKIILWRRCSLKLIFLAVVAKDLKEHFWPSIYLENCGSNPNNGSIALLCHWGTFLVVQPPNPIFWPSWTFFKLFHTTYYIYFLLKIARMGFFFFFCNEAAFQVVLVVKNPPANAGDLRDTGSIPGLGRSPAGGHDNPLQYSCLEDPRERGVRGYSPQGCEEWNTTEAT